jgi:hypothetical protein
MTYVKPAHLLFTFTTILVLVSTLSCGGADRHPERDGVAWFVQVTDPHLFLDTSRDADAAKKSAREKQEKLDQSALSDLWKQLPSLPHGDRPLSFLVMTGDFGIEPCSIADIPVSVNSQDTPKAKDCLEKVSKEKRNSQITVLADLLGGSPVRDIYLIPGNNDIPFETASDDGIAYFNLFIEEVQKRIDDSKKNVQLHNLNRCYLGNGAASSCYADIQDTPYRMLGFPSYSFKNREPGYESNTAPQEKQFETFRSLLDASRQAGKRVLILTHIPLIDDPYTLAQDRYAAVSPPAAIDKDPKNARSVWSTWNVSKKLADEWEEAIASDSVTAVFAGHLHDSHKEIYQRPYLWSTTNDHKTGFRKLYMAPPLSVKNQDSSPVQARGFALAGLDPDQIRYSIYWYNSQTHDFVPDRAPRFQREGKRGRWEWWQAITRTIAWLCHQDCLDRLSVLFIALVSAYLTVVQIWQIPPADNPLTATAKTSDDQKEAKKNNGGAKTTDSKPAFDPSPFASNFGKTVITGLGGLAAATVLQSLEGKPTAEDRQFYIVWFVIFFFAILFLSAILRAFGEALRTRLAIIYYPPPPPPRASGTPANKKRLKTGKDELDGEETCKPSLWDRLVYWLYYRPFYWLVSLRVPFLTFIDTFVNLIQGKNQTMTRVFSDKIIDQQRNVVRVANVIRQQLNDVILRYVSIKDPTVERDARDVRVNISVLSADQSSLFYIARTAGSGLKSFPRRSVAWISVFTGKIRWYKHAYINDKPLFPKIVLFDNSAGVIPDAEKKILLSSYYQERDDDYDAFVIFPVPWPQRGYGSDYVKGAIHISFRRQTDFDRIWKFKLSPEDLAATPERNPDPVLYNDPDKGYTYQSEDRMLDDWFNEDTQQVKATLREAVFVLGELLRGFNENIYKSSGAAG